MVVRFQNLNQFCFLLSSWLLPFAVRILFPWSVFLMDEDGPWEDPHHLRKKRNVSSLGNQNMESITKFFVTNLPQGCTPWEVS
ncbi:hypothetical protein Hanom_Chr11g00982471 [Helianthus anomalus]